MTFRTRLIAGSLFLLFVLVHLHPYLYRYVLPHADNLYVLHVIDYIRSPGWFGDSQFSRYLYEFHARTAPIYYYGLAVPLSFLLGSKGSFLAIGMGITFVTACFAGDGLKTRRDLLLAILVLTVVIHDPVSTLAGNRRSFTALFLAGALWSGSNPGLLIFGLLVGFAGGIYAPAGLLLITYYATAGIRRWWHKGTSLKTVLLKTTGLAGLFGLVLTPYWWNVIQSSGETTAGVTPHINYLFSTIPEVFRTLFLSRGGLFNQAPSVELTVGLLIVLGLQGLLLRNDFRRPPKYALLFVSVMLVWGLAHLVHPLIYQPFKYTRVALPLVVVFLIGENLSLTLRRIRQKFSGMTSAVLSVYGLTILALSAWLIFNFVFHLPGIWWKFVLALPVCLFLILGAPDDFHPTALSVTASVLFLAMVFLPHCFVNCEEYVAGTAGDSTKTASTFHGLYKKLRTTPEGSTVAGPVYFMTVVPAYGKRGFYAEFKVQSRNFHCNRIRTFRRKYFSNSRSSLKSFLQNKGVDYLIVDRSFFGLRGIHEVTYCAEPIELDRKSYLNRHFPEALWQKERTYYLLDVDAL